MVGCCSVPLADIQYNPLPPLRLTADNFGQVLIACSVDDGKLYEWNLDTAIGSELITNGTFDADSDWTKGNGGAGRSNWIIASNYAQNMSITNPHLMQVMLLLFLWQMTQ